MAGEPEKAHARRNHGYYPWAQLQEAGPSGLLRSIQRVTSARKNREIRPRFFCGRPFSPSNGEFAGRPVSSGIEVSGIQ